MNFFPMENRLDNEILVRIFFQPFKVNLSADTPALMRSGCFMIVNHLVAG